MTTWLQQEFDVARESLIEVGISKKALQRIRVKPFSGRGVGRAYVNTGGNIIYISSLWIAMVKAFPFLVEAFHGVIRHELGHILIHRYPKIAKEFALGDYPDLTWWDIVTTTLLEGYQNVCKEEWLCEQIRERNPEVIKRLVRIIRK